MAQYIRVLAERTLDISVGDLRSVVEGDCPHVRIEIVRGDLTNWQQLALRHDDGSDISLIDRSVVARGELAETEIREFLLEMRTARPRSAARWLETFLQRIKVIFAFEIGNGADSDEAWNAIYALYGHFHEKCGGIYQADGEGFSNTDGSHILWQFGDSVEGLWQMAILNASGDWIKFKMDLGNRYHRAAFLEGVIPGDVSILK